MKVLSLLLHLLIFLILVGTKIKVEFKESFLKQGNTTFTQGKIVDIYIVYKINKILISAVIQY